MVVEDKLIININKIAKHISELSNIEELYNYSKKLTDIDIVIDGCDITSNRIVYFKNFLFKLLIKKENELLSKENNNCTSLNKILKKKLMNGEKLQDFFKRCYCKNRNIGTIPKCFLNNVSDKKSTAIAIYNLFAEYSLKLNYDYEFDYDEYDYDKDYLSPDTDSFVQKLSTLINKPVQMDYVGSGYNGNGFKITIDNQSFFYKVFYLYNSIDPKRYYNHGGLAEPQMALFASKNSPKSKFAKFFFGRVCNLISYDSFLVTEFVERKNNINTNKNLVLDYVKISETEENKFDNKINGKIVDFGGIKISHPELNDKKLRRLIRVILSFINYKHDENLLYYKWSITSKNICILKQYLLKYDMQSFVAALNLIKKYQKFVIDEYVELLLNMFKKHCHDDFMYCKYLSLADLLKQNVEELQNIITKFNLKVTTRSEPIVEFNSLGYLIIKLQKNVQVVCFYDINNKIHNVRIEKNIDNNIDTIVEYTYDKGYPDYQDIELYKILT